MRFKHWRFECTVCGTTLKPLQWNYDPPPIHCGKFARPEYLAGEMSAAVIGDEIDVTIEHGPCNPDGSPRRYRSRSELNREAAALGWVREGETPHPERIDESRR